MYKNITPASQTSHDCRCSKRRSFPFKTNEDSHIKKKVSAEIHTLLNALMSSPKWDTKTIREELEKTYNDFGVDFEIDAVKKSALNMMSALISRYINSETRTPLPPASVKTQIFSLEGYSEFMSVKPHLVFAYKENGEDVIECVKIKTGKAVNFTQSGTKRDASPQKSIELYLLFCYARLLARPGKRTVIKGSYYFLKDKDEYKTNTAMLTADYFATKNTIFTLEDSVTKDADGKFKNSYTDISFRDQLIDFDKGQDAEECTAEDCAHCDLREFCFYNKAPVFKVKEKRKAAVRTLDLSAAQLDVINFDKGFGRVNAGAGAGKTLVVSFNVVNGLEKGCKEEDFLLITFTNNGATEMRERIEAYIKDDGLDDEVDASKIKICTFNAFCNDIVIEEYAQLGFSAPPRVIKDVERAKIITSITDKHLIDGIDYNNFINDNIFNNAPSGFDIVAEAFRIIKANRLSTGDETKLKELLGARYFNSMKCSLTGLTQLLEAYNEYDQLLKLNNLIEYEDQELLLFDLLSIDPYYLEKFGYKHIIIDEFQDTSERQMDIIKELVDTPSFESLLVVGDDSQAIYGFRNTSPEYIINFFDKIDAPEDERFDFKLVDNYRCTPEIIAVANKYNSLNENRLDKDLIAHRESLDIPVKVNGFYTKDDELDFIVEGIKNRIAAGEKPENIAVLGRDRTILAKIGERLAEAAIPCVNMNPEYILENSKVVAGIELAKAIDNPQNTKAILVYLNAKYENTLLSYPVSDIEKEAEELSRKLETVKKMNAKDKVEEFFSMLEDINYDSDELYEDFIESLKFRKTFEQQLEYILLTEKYGKRQTYKREKDYPGVVLTTMHSSKGLEWSVVYMSMDKLDEEIYHHHNYGGRQAAVEELRRLVFVSMTRARDELVVTGVYEIKKQVYNRFLKDAFTCAGLDKFYVPVDPNADVKKALKEKEKAEEKIRRAEEKKRMIEEAESKGLITNGDMVVPLSAADLEKLETEMA